jgi:glycosyltransferase involved in cell wall biosynthesis/O-antigen/teichoic acid export membrane protein
VFEHTQGPRRPPTVCPVHILVLTDRDWTHPQGGGTGTNLYGQVSRWLAWGHRVSVIAAGYQGGDPLERHGDLTMHRVGGRSTVFPRAILKQWRGLVPDADVVLEVINGITFLTPIWLRAPRVGLVHHVHTDHYAREMGRVGKVAGLFLETLPLKLLYPGSRFVVISHATQRDLERFGITPDTVTVNHIGVELDAFAPGERAAEPTLLYLGRLKKYKRVEMLLETVEALPGTMLEIAGDGDHLPDLEAEIERRGIGERVRIHGHVEEKKKVELLQRSWVNLTASSAEGWCLTVMEAAACRTPSVAMRVGGLPESIEDGVTGFLADDGDELTAHVRTLVEDTDLRKRMGAAAFERAQEFTWDRTARRTLDVLEAEQAAEPARPPMRELLAGFSRSDTGRAAGLAAAVMAANLFALAYTIVFARVLHSSGYGSLAALVSTFLILSVPGSALQMTVAREVSRAVAAGERYPAAGVWGWLTTLGAITVGASIVSVLCRNLIAHAVGVADLPWAASAAIPAGCLWLILSVQRGALQGLQRYKLVGFSLIGEAVMRLLAGLLLVGLGASVTGAFLGTAVSVGAVAVALTLPLLRAAGPHSEHHEKPLRQLVGRAWAPVAALALIAVLQNIDVIVVKHVAEKHAAGAYAAAAVIAKGVIWVAVGLGLYLLPEAARRTRMGVDARPVLVRTLALVAVVSVPAALLYVVAARPVLIAVFGKAYAGGAGALPVLAVAMSLLACAYLSVQYLLALERANFLWALAAAAIAEPLVLQALGSHLTAVATGLLVVQVFLATVILSLGFRSAASPHASGAAAAA